MPLPGSLTLTWLTSTHSSGVRFTDFSHNIGLPWWLRWSRICLRCSRPRFHPWVRKIPWRKEQQPTPAFLPENFHGHSSLAGYSPWGRNERLTLSLFGHCNTQGSRHRSFRELTGPCNFQHFRITAQSTSMNGTLITAEINEESNFQKHCFLKERTSTINTLPES